MQARVDQELVHRRGGFKGTLTLVTQQSAWCRAPRAVSGEEQICRRGLELVQVHTL